MNFSSIIEKHLLAAQNIVITTHIYPDADGIGSQIALCQALRQKQKNVVCVNEKPLLDRYQYLDPKNFISGYEAFIKSDFDQSPDLLIVVDTNKVERVGYNLQELSTKAKKTIFIDHHPFKDIKAGTHYIDTSSAATGQMVGQLIEAWDIDFDPIMALALYTAIIIDTSSFRYPTVTARTHRLIAKLLDTGIQPADAYNGIYGAKKIEHMHLLGSILATSDINKRRDIAWIVLNKEELAKYDTDIEDTHAFINNLLILENIKIACMFRDDGDSLKISFRSTGDIDVGKIALELGGGGHSHSAATIIDMKNPSDLEDKINDIINKVECYVDKMD